MMVNGKSTMVGGNQTFVCGRDKKMIGFYPQVNQSGHHPVKLLFPSQSSACFWRSPICLRMTSNFGTGTGRFR